MELYVSPLGSDMASGSLEEPLRSIPEAQKRLRALDPSQRKGRKIILRQGVHYLSETLVLTPEDSGLGESPLHLTSFEEESVVLSGGTLLKLDWVPWKNGIMKASTEPGLEMDQLFVNGQRQHMARYPNFDPSIKPYGGYGADAFSRERAEGWAKPEGGFIHAVHSAHWGGYHYRITGKDDEGNVTYEGGWQNNRQMGMHERFRFVENIFEELDAPGEWYHDSEEGILYYYPVEGLDLVKAKIEIARLPHLIELKGSEEQPIQNISISGIIFKHTARTFMETKEPLLRSDWTIYRGGAVVLKGAEDCSIIDCQFDQVGGNGLFADQYNRRLRFVGNHIHGAGASGICFVGSPDCVRNPLFEYNERQSYEDLDLTPGPKGSNFPKDCLVEDCLIHGIGVVEKQATGVQVSMSHGITIRHCSIYDVGRAGINISEGTFGGHLIEHCDVFDTVLETGDHGSFNSWGRDRFWELEGAPPEKLAELMLLDAEKSVIRNSRWRCDHGWDVDLDDGSSNYEIYNNLLLGRGLKLREGFFRKAYNNVAPCGTLHPHVWYARSEDVVKNNIWMMKYRIAGMKHWDGEIDHNLFLREADKDAFSEQGCDHNSLHGDPLFVDPASGDYSVREESPALKVGFKNFPMDQFGVKSARLKAIARVPEFPTPLKESKDGEALGVQKRWRGVTLRDISGEEFSAFGTRKEDGGVHLLQVPRGSVMGEGGFKNDDLIQGVGGVAIKNVEQFLKVVEDQEGELEIAFVRKQVKQTLKLLNG